MLIVIPEFARSRTVNECRSTGPNCSPMYSIASSKSGLPREVAGGCSAAFAETAPADFRYSTTDSSEATSIAGHLDVGVTKPCELKI